MSYDPTNPDSINPDKWQRRKAFYFDGNIALMMGHYDGDAEECIGMRWMVAEGPQGYPVTRGYPQWMATPDRLALYMLEGIAGDRDQERARGHIRDETEFDRALTLVRVKFQAL
jgi:hypothetical protein